VKETGELDAGGGYLGEEIKDVNRPFVDDDLATMAQHRALYIEHGVRLVVDVHASLVPEELRDEVLAEGEVVDALGHAGRFDGATACLELAHLLEVRLDDLANSRGGADVADRARGDGTENDFLGSGLLQRAEVVVDLQGRGLLELGFEPLVETNGFLIHASSSHGLSANYAP